MKKLSEGHPLLERARNKTLAEDHLDSVADRLYDFTGCPYLGRTQQDKASPGRSHPEKAQEREHQQGVVSDARQEDFDMLRQHYQPLQEREAGHLLTVETHQPLSESVSQIYQQLAGLNLGQT